MVFEGKRDGGFADREIHGKSNGWSRARWLEVSWGLNADVGFD